MTSQAFALISFILAVFSIGCGKANSTPAAEIIDADEMVYLVAAAFGDDLEAPLTVKGLKPPSWLYWFAPKEAHAARCYQQAWANCDQGFRIRRLLNCSSLGGATEVGEVRLKFSNTNCTFTSTGDSITWIPEYSFIGRKGALVKVTSESRQDFSGNRVVGGQKMTKTSGGHSLDILGITREAYSNDSLWYQLTLRTTDSMPITGKARTDRYINGGELETSHQSGYRVKWIPENIRYTVECPCPTSGFLKGTVSGKYSGTAQIEFLSECGRVKSVWNGVEANLRLDAC